MSWLLIETAPKDGSVFIGFDPEIGVRPMMWSEGEYYPTGGKYVGWVDAVDFNHDDGGSWRFEVSPTLWQPLPDPPKPQ